MGSSFFRLSWSALRGTLLRPGHVIHVETLFWTAEELILNPFPDLLRSPTRLVSCCGHIKKEIDPKHTHGVSLEFQFSATTSGSEPPEPPLSQTYKGKNVRPKYVDAAQKTSNLTKTDLSKRPVHARGETRHLSAIQGISLLRERLG